MGLTRHEIYFDRDASKIDGVVTLQRVKDGQVTKLFDRLPATSGQNGWTKTDWNQGKSPMPFGRHLLRTRSAPLQMEPRGTPFFPVGTDSGIIGIIRSGNKFIRENCGLHLENKYPGTAGCVALLHDTPERKEDAWALFHYLESIQTSELFIPFIVL